MRSRVLVPCLVAVLVGGVLGLVPACGGGSSAPSPPPSASAAAVASTATPGGAKAPVAEKPDATRDGARALVANILVGGEAMKTLTDLTDAFGPRLAGSDVYANAAAWARDRFRAYGLDAALETFPMEHGWTRGTATGTVVSPAARTLHVASLAWSPGTTAPVRAEVLLMKDTSADAIAEHKADMVGKIVLDAGKRTPGGPPRYPGVDMTNAGAVAVMTEADRAGNELTAGKCRAPKDALCEAPRFSIGHEDAEMIRRLLDAGKVTVELTSTAQITGPVDVPNVIAEIKGQEKPDEVVMLGAHLDSWDFANGAQDNGSGAAEVLEAARALRALGTPPRRTIRFALWGGEEEGLLGSRAWVKAHAKDLDHVVAYLNTDHGATVPTGWGTGGREDLSAAMRPLAKDLLTGLGATEIESKVFCATDHCPFMVQGVPTLNLDVDDTHYVEIHHLATDTLDKVKEGWLSQGAAVMAVTAYAISQADAPIAPRIGHDAIAKTLVGSDSLPSMIAGGLWTP